MHVCSVCAVCVCVCALSLNLCRAQRNDSVKKKKESDGRNTKIRKGSESKRERIPCCFSNQEASSSSLGDLFSLPSSSCPNFQPPLHPTPPHPSIHSFSLSFFLRAAREHSCLEMMTEARSRRAALLTWLTCKAVRFSYEVFLLLHFFSFFVFWNHTGPNIAAADHQTSRIFYFKSSIKWCMTLLTDINKCLAPLLARPGKDHPT